MAKKKNTPVTATTGTVTIETESVEPTLTTESFPVNEPTEIIIKTEPIPVVEQIVNGIKVRFAGNPPSKDTSKYRTWEPVYLNLFEFKFNDKMARDRAFPMMPEVPVEEQLVWVSIDHRTKQVYLNFNENAPKTHVFTVANRISKGETIRLGDATLSLYDRSGAVYVKITLRGLTIEGVDLPLFDYTTGTGIAEMHLTCAFRDWDVETFPV